MTRYTPTWYANFQSASARSAREIVPLVMDLVPARSVVDVGCGLGVWLREFQRQGATSITGFDGDYVDESQLKIMASEFHGHDLRQPLPHDRTFDLAVSLEVAEHLPDECADRFIDDLTRFAPVVLFSAAIPQQGGTQHINERWPQYWADLFAKRGFQPVDVIRPLVWNRTHVDFWYCQNTLLYANAKGLSENPKLCHEHEKGLRMPLSIVHPRLYSRVADRLECTVDFRVRRLVRRVIKAAWR